MRAAPLFFALVLVSSCKPSVPAELRYRLRFVGDDVVPGLEVQRDGASVGKVTAAGTLEFTTPSEVRPTKLQLTAILPTPCGATNAPLVLETLPTMDEDRTVADRMKREGALLITAKLPSVRRFPLLVDGGNQPLEIGQATIPAGMSRSALFEKPDCAATAPVKVGGEVVGTWRASAPVTFISVPATCHRLTTVSFGNAAAGSSKIFQQRVRVLDKVPDFFLQPAPTSVSAKPGVKERYLQELLSVECPAGPSPAELARQTFERGGCLEAVVVLKRAVAWNDEDLESTTRLVMCLAQSFSVREATELAEETLKQHPEAREKLREAFVTAGHPEVTLGQ